MHKFLSTIVLLIIAAAQPLSAVQVRSYADAVKKASEKKPAILFCYGANYDDYSKRVLKEFIENRRSPVFKILSREVFVVVPIYQLPTEKEKREQQKATGGRGLPGGIWSYPSFTLIDHNGNNRGSVRSSDELADPETAANALAKLIEDYKEQQKLLEKAAKTKGSNQSKLRNEAINIGSISVPGHKSYDPANNGLVQDLQTMSIPQAHNHIRNILNTTELTKVERQMVLSAYAGHVRRSKGPIHLLRAIYTEMRNIDPSTSYAAYAEGALELWVIPHETDSKPKAQAEADKDKKDTDAKDTAK